MKRYAEIRNTIQSYRVAGHSDAVITRHLIRNEELPQDMTRFLVHSMTQTALTDWMPSCLLRAVQTIRRQYQCPDALDAMVRASAQLSRTSTLDSAYLTLDFLRGELRSYGLPGRFGEALDVLIAHGLNVINLQDQPYLALISAKEVGVIHGVPTAEFWGSMLRLWIEPQTAESRLQAQAA